MKTATKEQSAKLVGYKIILGLVIGAAALSNATKDLNQLQDLADNVWRLGSQLLDVGVATVSARSISGDASCKNVNSADQLRRNTQMRPTIDLNGDVSVNLPSNGSTEFKADAFNRSTSSDFPGSMFRFVRQRRVSGTSGNDRRELVLKTGSIILRPVG